MPSLPTATTALNDQAGSFAGSTGFLVVLAAVALNADITPRVFASAKGITDLHGYSPGADYAALHIEATRKPIIFVGLPIVTPGAVGRQNGAGVLGTSVISIAAGPQGFLEETDGILQVPIGGTVGTSGIQCSLSLDGGRTYQAFRLGTATSYTVPLLGIVINFAAGTLLTGDTYTFVTTAPKWDAAGIANARLALRAQLKQSRSWLVIGDLVSAAEAGYVTTAVNAYETADQRFTLARVNLRDRLPIATKSKLPKTMVGAPNLTFAAAGFTITRSAGSFLAEGFAVGDVVTIAGTVSNNASRAVTGVTATVLTFASGIANEGPIGSATIVGSEGLVFAATTITRSTGSWLADGFRVGDAITVSGTASNNFTKTITALTATVLTFASGGVAETIGSANVTAVKGETMAQWVSQLDTDFVTVDAQKRIDLAIGRLRKLSPLTNWLFRRPVAWAASIREYTKSEHVPCWRKEDGPLDGWSMVDATGKTVEFDQRTDGGGLEARFTCARSWGNGPEGAFIALSLTRWNEGSLLSRTHNMAVANIVCSVVQAATEMIIGKTPALNPNGTIREDQARLLESRVNTDLEQAVLQSTGPDGPRASSCVWRTSRSDILNVVGATVTGVAATNLNGTIENINTSVRIATAGA